MYPHRSCDTDGVVYVFSSNGTDVECKVELARTLLLREFREVSIGLGRQSNSGPAPRDMQLDSIETRISRNGQEFLDAQSAMEKIELHAVTVEKPSQLIYSLKKLPPQDSIQLRDGGSDSCRSPQENLKSGLQSHLGPSDAELF